MRRLELTKIDQQIDLENGQVNVVLIFNRGELKLPVGQEAFVELMKYMTTTPEDANFSSSLPDLSHTEDFYVKPDGFVGRLEEDDFPPQVYQDDHPEPQPQVTYNYDNGGVVDDDDISQI